MIPIVCRHRAKSARGDPSCPQAAGGTARTQYRVCNPGKPGLGRASPAHVSGSARSSQPSASASPASISTSPELRPPPIRLGLDDCTRHQCCLGTDEGSRRSPLGWIVKSRAPRTSPRPACPSSWSASSCISPADTGKVSPCRWKTSSTGCSGHVSSALITRLPRLTRGWLPEVARQATPSSSETARPSRLPKRTDGPSRPETPSPSQQPVCRSSTHQGAEG